MQCDEEEDVQKRQFSISLCYGKLGVCQFISILFLSDSAAWVFPQSQIPIPLGKLNQKDSLGSGHCQ